jgi:hypothetical protein
MKKMMQSKISVSASDPSGKTISILEIGRFYECQAVPKTYDPATFELSPPRLIVKCEDGKERIYQAEHFIDLQEAREIKLGHLGI